MRSFKIQITVFSSTSSLLNHETRVKQENHIILFQIYKNKGKKRQGKRKIKKIKEKEGEDHVRERSKKHDCRRCYMKRERLEVLAY